MNTLPDFGNLPAAFFIGLAIGGLIVLTILILFLLNLMQTLQQCAPQNQKMAPGLVWLMLIPLFSTVWIFFVVGRIAESLAAEYRSRNLTPSEERPGYQIGMAYAMLGVAGYVQYLGIPFLGQLCGLAGFVCWIIYWVRIAKFKRELMAHQPFTFGQGNPYQFPNQPNAQQQNPQNYQHGTPPNYNPPPQNPQNPYQ